MAQTDMIDTKAIWTLVFYHSIADCGAAWKKTMYLVKVKEDQVSLKLHYNNHDFHDRFRKASEKSLKLNREEQRRIILIEIIFSVVLRESYRYGKKRKYFSKKDQVVLQCSVTTTAREAFTILPRVQLPSPLHPL